MRISDWSSDVCSSDLAMPGVAVNQAFLVDCLRADAFAEGRATTAFLEETFPDGWQPDARQLLTLRAQAATALIDDAAGSPLLRTDGFRVTKPPRPGPVPRDSEADRVGEDGVRT